MTDAARVGVIPGQGVVVRRDATVAVIGLASDASPELADQLIEVVERHDGDDRIRQMVRLALAEREPPDLAVATIEGDAVHVFLYGQLDFVSSAGRSSGAGEVLGRTLDLPLGDGFGIVHAGAEVPTLAAWNHLDQGSVRGDGVVVVTGAAVSPPAESEPAPEPESQPEPESPPPPPPPPPPAEEAIAAPAFGHGSFDSIPLTADADLSERVPLPIEGRDDEEAAADEGPAYERPVQVVGVYSPKGFFNHPDAKYCSRTGVKMGASHTKVLTTGPRPPLGVITLDDGATLTVRWNTVIGRDPALDEQVQRGEAAPFVVTDVAQSVSRRHALLELVEWDVLISDLGSRNLTYVQDGPDEPRRALATGERTALHTGMIVHLGDRSFVYNEHHVR